MRMSKLSQLLLQGPSTEPVAMEKTTDVNLTRNMSKVVYESVLPDELFKKIGVYCPFKDQNKKKHISSKAITIVSEHSIKQKCFS